MVTDYTRIHIYTRTHADTHIHDIKILREHSVSNLIRRRIQVYTSSRTINSTKNLVSPMICTTKSS